MKFKNFFNDTQVIHELTTSTISRLPKNLQDLLKDKKLPFNHIFGDKLRLVEPLLKKSEYDQRIRTAIDNSDFELDFEKWAGYKLTDKDKKNPIRIGKLLSKRKADLNRQIKETNEAIKAREEEIKAKEAENPEYAQTVLPSDVVWYKMSDEQQIILQWQEKLKFIRVAIASHKYNIAWLENRISDIDELLKITDLQKAYKDTQNSDFVTIYSRVPVDVARMSDFTWRSCHSEDGDYFHCALADATLNAGVVYLVNRKEYDQLISEEGEAIIQRDELFEDVGRSVGGLKPLARIRIRNLLDDKGNSLAVPSLRIYKDDRKTGFEEPFKESVIAWAKKQDISNYNWDHTLFLKGGSYEDMNYDMTNMVQRIWGKKIQYIHDDQNDEMFRLSLDNTEGAEEEWWEEQRDEVDRKIERIYQEALGKKYDDIFDISYHNRTGVVDIRYKLDGDFLDKVKKIIKDTNRPNIISEEYEISPDEKNQFERAEVNHPFTAIISLNSEDVLIRSENRIRMEDFGTYVDANENYFDISEFEGELEKYIRFAVEGFAEFETTNSIYSLFNKLIMNNRILGILEQPSEDADIEWDDFIKFFDKYVWEKTGFKPENLADVEIPDLEFSYSLTGFGGTKLDMAEEQVDEILDIWSGIDSNLFDIIIHKFANGDDKFWEQYLRPLVYLEKRETNQPPNKARYDVRSSKDYHKSMILIATDESKSSMKLQIFLDDDRFANIIDAGNFHIWIKIMDWLTTDLKEELKSAENIYQLDKLIKNIALKIIPSTQLELDLSSINSNMNKFDSLIKSLIEDGLGNMGTGGITGQGGAGTSPMGKSSSSGGTKPVTGGVQMKASATPAKPMNPATISSPQAGQPQVDYAALFNSEDPTAMNLFRADPKNIEGFKSFLGDEKNRTAFKQSVDPSRYGDLLDMLI